MNKQCEFISQYVLNNIMNKNYELLNSIGEQKYEKIFEDKDSVYLKTLNILITQIRNDEQIGNRRSAFRKAVLLKGLLHSKLQGGEY